MSTPERPPVVFEGLSVERRRLSRARAAAVVAAALASITATVAAVLVLIPTPDGSLAPLAAVLAAVATALAGATAACALASIAALVFALGARRAPARITVGEAGVAIERGDRVEVIAHESIDAAWSVPERDELVLRLAGGDRVRVGPLPSRDFLGAIAAGATERALELSIQRRTTGGRIFAAIAGLPVVGVLLELAATTDSLPAVVGASALLGVIWFLFLTRFGAPRRVVVGHDGIALEGDGRSAFLPYATLTAAYPSLDGVILERPNGATIPVALLPGRAGREGELSRLRRDHLVETIRGELAAWRAGGGDPLGAAQLDRAGRSIAAWRAALRDLLGKQAGGYRAAAIDPDHLTRVLWTRDLAPERRLGAALALAQTGDPELRQRVRIFIDTSAGGALRDAVAAAAEDEIDEASLEQAMARIER
jgi:hypothetical protein